MQILARNLDELAAFAEEFVLKLKPSGKGALIVGLSGELGSGKTTFVKACAKALGVTERVISPTFVILKTFGLKNSPFKKFVHIDAYRLESGKEIQTLEWDELADDPQNLIFIEWPENIADVMPDKYIKAHFQFIDENTRKIEVVQ